MRDNYWNRQLPQNQARSESAILAYLLSNRRVTANNCWEWMGPCNPKGYGKIKWHPFGDVRVHRLAAMLWLGFRLNDSQYVCHKCDNPSCFNPEHLFIGTSRDNQLDCVQKGRNPNKTKTHCKHGHEFSPENTWLEKTGARHCRTCHRLKELVRYQAGRMRQ